MSGEQSTAHNVCAMDDEQFHQWQGLLEERTGMSLSPERKSFLETSLRIRMREIGYASFQDYFESLKSGLAGEMEWHTLVDRLTVQETRFFRHASSFRLVSNQVAQWLHADERKRTLNLWSVGCATGEEAYSLAMGVDQTIRQHGLRTYYGVTGTDISLPALSKAGRGVYQRNKLEPVPQSMLDAYFQHISAHEYQVVPEIREKICFARINVLELDRVPFYDMDIIFCQNLLIYFRRWRKKAIIHELAKRLNPGGLLVLGVGEIVGWSHPELERVPDEDTLAYTRRRS